MRIHLLSLPLVAAVLTGCSPKKPASKAAPGTMPAVAAKQSVNFATDIKPMFDKSCVDCHGPKKQKAGLRLDSLAASVHGSDDGPVFEVGKSEFSVMISNVARIGIEDDWMPPIDDKHEPLTQEEIGLIRAWIDQGAK